MSDKDSPQEFLGQPNVAILATVDKNGAAHAVPIWYLYEDGELVMSTGRGSQKHRNVEANPDVTLVVDRRTLPYYAVMARGRAEIGSPMTGDERLRLAVRYLGDDMGRAYAARRAGGDSITIRLRPSKLIEYHGVAGRPENG